jgi:hypothetical protein
MSPEGFAEMKRRHDEGHPKPQNTEVLREAEDCEEKIKKQVAGLLGVMRSNIDDMGQYTVAEIKLKNILKALADLQEKMKEVSV